MPEDAGKKRYIRDFLQNVESGTGSIDDIRIERVIIEPGFEGKGSKARSLSGRNISNITELLEDDLSHTFDDGYFTFRFVAANVGSGKTSLLDNLELLTKTQPSYENHAVVIRFQLNEIIDAPGKFYNKLYQRMITDTLWQLFHNQNLVEEARNKADEIIGDFLENTELSALKGVKKIMPFRLKINKYLLRDFPGLEDLFFNTIKEVSSVDSRFTFVYLIDELDALEKFTDAIIESRLLFKELIRKAYQDFNKKIRLLVYLVGTSGNAQTFIYEDSVIESLVKKNVINLSSGYTDEFLQIRNKIDDRIKGAYKNYKDFNKAWQEIKDIPLPKGTNLREFCQTYARAILEIHERYFKEKPEQVFEGNARELVKAECNKQWASFLKQKAYKLSSVSTTTVIKDRAFDAYAELLHNDRPVARAFGEAKNYELLSSHLDTFSQWLKDVDFQSRSDDKKPPDLAFIIAPSCLSLLQRKLDLQKIQFIPADKITNPAPSPTPNPEVISTSVPTPKPPPEKTLTQTTAVNINKASKGGLVNAFKGSGVKRKTIDKLIELRNNQPCKNLDDLIAYLKTTENVKKKLQKKLDNNEICF
ncbi:MAG: hypothetical protein F6K35_11575 [Okeania sp. SIO2H7]|nr:hypothetical protein [Okeania sp. SIO2H7]